MPPVHVALKTKHFAFDNVALVRTNLREGVIWVRPDTEDQQETTQEMADDYIRMGCAEAKYAKPPTASGEQSVNKNILIAGGGISGMTAAIEASKAGYPCTIVEKSGAYLVVQLHSFTKRFQPKRLIQIQKIMVSLN